MSEPGPMVEVRRRIGAYALIQRVVEGRTEVVLAQLAPGTSVGGRWTLPGGGIEHGEGPREAVVREVYEETGLYVEPGDVVEVYHHHAVRTRSDGVDEDYHGLYIVYHAELLPASYDVVPHVTEVAGSTVHSEWVPLEEARGRALLVAAAAALDQLT